MSTSFPLRNSLIVRLIAAGILLVVVGTALRYALMTRFLRQDLEQVVAAQQLALASYVANDIDVYIGERQDMLVRMANSLPAALLDHPADLHRWLRERHDLLPLFSKGIVAFSVDGVAIADYPQVPGREGYRVRNNPDFVMALNGQAGVGRPLIGPVSRQPIVPVTAPIRDARGKVAGVLVGIIALSSPGFLDVLEKTRIGQNGGILLISPRDELFVASTDPSLTLQPTPPKGINPLHDRAMAGYRGTGIAVSARGVEELSALASVPRTGWFVVARIPTSEAFATVSRAQSYIVNNSLFIILLVITIVAFTTWRILKPLHDAARQADRMTHGEMPLAPLEIKRDDEVGHLTAAFNRLLLKLLGSQQELSHLAHHDGLTGLPNRRMLADRLRQALARTQRNGTYVAMLFMDLDQFKPINDRFGHEAGDEALCQVAARLVDTIREGDTVARVGGDEFIIIATDLEGPVDAIVSMAESIADKCIAVLSQPLRIADEEASVGVSIGIAIGRNLSSDALMKAADDAMYAAKEAGRGRYVVAPLSLADS